MTPLTLCHLKATQTEVKTKSLFKFAAWLQLGVGLALGLGWDWACNRVRLVPFLTLTVVLTVAQLLAGATCLS